jgi:hypothetical protein
MVLFSLMRQIQADRDTKTGVLVVTRYKMENRRQRREKECYVAGMLFENEKKQKKIKQGSNVTRESP